jgi:glycosyltransferase involved in cell wall biosynthesis
MPTTLSDTIPVRLAMKMNPVATMPSPPVRKTATRRGQRLVVGLPALNEGRTIGDVIHAIPREIPGIKDVEVLVIDDGSTDETGLRAAEAGAHVIRHESTRGVGAAFQTALAYAIERDADMIVSIDADGQFDPRTIPQLIEPVVAGRADFSTASRFADPALAPQMPWIKRWGNRMMSRLISRLAGRSFHDVSCGMRCYNRRAALSLNLLGCFTYTQEVFLNLAFKNMRIVEVPIAVRGEPRAWQEPRRAISGATSRRAGLSFDAIAITTRSGFGGSSRSR